MMQFITTFAGSVCFDFSESDYFVVLMFLYGVVLAVIAAIITLFTVIFYIRKSLHEKRKYWLKMLAASTALLYMVLGLGWLVGSNEFYKISTETCETAVSTGVGTFLNFLSVAMILVIIALSLVYLLNFKNKKP